jgi:hypothetical protein
MKPWLKIILKELSGSINDKRRFVSHIECEVASFKPLGVGPRGGSRSRAAALRRLIQRLNGVPFPTPPGRPYLPNVRQDPRKTAQQKEANSDRERWCLL